MKSKDSLKKHGCFNPVACGKYRSNKMAVFKDIQKMCPIVLTLVVYVASNWSAHNEPFCKYTSLKWLVFPLLDVILFMKKNQNQNKKFLQY